jgi:hypothetical protein
MVLAKRVIVIALIAVLGSSVVVGGISLYNRSTLSTANNPSNSVIGLNTRLNNVVSFCMNSLPSGIKACDNELRSLVSQVCVSTNGQLDACHNGLVDQYYKIRAQQEVKAKNTTSGGRIQNSSISSSQ